MKSKLVLAASLLLLGASMLLPTGAQGGTIVQSFYSLVQNAGSDLTRRTTLNCTGAGITCSDSAGKTVLNVPGIAGNVIYPAFQFTVDGGGAAITTGALGFFPSVDFACTINKIDVTADQSGSFTADIWKAAGAIPTGANKISASAPATLSSSQISIGGSLTGWTTSVSVGDVFGGTIATSSTVTRVTVTVWCQ